MKALASFQDLYVGLEPYRNAELVGGGVLQSTAPAVFGLLAAIELHPSNDKSGGEYRPKLCRAGLLYPCMLTTSIQNHSSFCPCRRLSSCHRRDGTTGR